MEPGTGNPSSSAGADGSITSDGSLANTYTITGKSPDGKPMTFWVFTESCWIGIKEEKLMHGSKKFENVTEFTFTKANEGDTDQVCIQADRPNYLFIDFLIPKNELLTQNGKSLNLAWDTLGSWGLAPNGVYLDSYDQQEKEKMIKTSVKNGKVVLTYAGTDAIVTHDVLSPDGQDWGQNLSGKISDDLHEIQISVDRPKAPENSFKTTLTLIK